MPAATTTPRPPLGRPKDPAKRAAVLEAAQQLFSEQGFDGVSMDQIAQTAGVSKLTVYSHFGDKDGLLSAVVRSHCEREMPLELFEPSPEVALRPRLLDIAHAFYAMVSCPQAIAGHRMLCAPHAMTPNMARLFWEAGPERIQNGLSEMLKRRVDAGELDIDDTDMAASHFFALLKGEPHARLMIGFPADMDQGATERHLASVVDLFLRAHQPAAS
ncbi:TetR/AcrR family transcriptional regulator [Solilutibacter tolerans]|uniref:Transcriptional regulator, TetR family n=1 Tax=Solilutibacter tolerans TaxID=1604334 RepID=A0A1N6ULH5_9GAMM|nr:TetR/AcrR family transcriptional regulator [Lysobacter tolerans]SIQ66460.1 transcriptional regulator, TetR family [Lysobacter tolerans]